MQNLLKQMDEVDQLGDKNAGLMNAIIMTSTDNNRILHRCELCMDNRFYTPQGTTIYAAVQGGLIWAHHASLDFSGSKFVANAVLPSGNNTARSNLVQGGLVYISAGDAANFSGAVFSQVPCEISCTH